MPFARGPVLYYVGLGRYLTVGMTEYVGRDQVITIGDSFPTDLASVPRLFWALIPPDGAYENAAVLHDWLCADLRAARREKRPPLVPARDADGLFRRVMREAGVGFITRWIMWAGVRWGALLDPPRRPGWWRDLPLVAAITAMETVALAAVTWGLHELVDVIATAAFG
jgi:hypothetical protein